MSILDILTGGKSGEASDAEKQALAALEAVNAPTAAQLSLPELEQYAVSQNMSPAQMQAFLQANNAYANENVAQTGTSAEQAALAQLANTANQGAKGNAIEQAQEAQILQDTGRTLAGQRGAIDQQAQARGVAPSLLQAALQQQNAGQDIQSANQAALQAQSGNYQTALNALAQQGQLGGQLQGQQNTQANTIAQAQNAMQQFNAANQQQAAAQNAGYQQQANQYNTGMANQVGQQNTGLANQRTLYNTNVPQQVYQDALQKAEAEAGQYGNIANTATQQGQQTAGIYSGLLGAGATAATGLPIGDFGGMTGTQAVGSGAGSTPSGANANPANYGIPQMGYADGGEIPYVNPQQPPDLGALQANTQQPSPDQIANIIQLLNSQSQNIQKGSNSYTPQQIQSMQANNTGRTTQYAHGGMADCDPGMNMKSGGPVPGHAQVPGDSPKNDTVHAKLSPGEVVIPRSMVQSHPEDIATLLQAMKHLRGAR